MRLLELDINQCPDKFYVPNAFKDTHKCDRKTSYVSSTGLLYHFHKTIRVTEWFKNIPLLLLHLVTRPLPLTAPKMWLSFYFQAKTLEIVDRGFIFVSITKHKARAHTYIMWVLNNETSLFIEIISSTCYPHFSLYVAILACAYSSKNLQCT
jgi:hypothetical protein